MSFTSGCISEKFTTLCPYAFFISSTSFTNASMRSPDKSSVRRYCVK